MASDEPAQHKLTFEEISRLNERKMQLKAEHSEYLDAHPELKTMLSDFMCQALMDKPEDVFAFARAHFAAYQPTLRDPNDPMRPLVIAGPSGAGKGTLIEMATRAFPEAFGFSVSHTTRGPREGETDGVQYNFTTREQMQTDIDSGLFIEFAEVHGNLYGTSTQAVEAVKAQGRICVLDIDVQGVRQVSKTALYPRYIFIMPPSMEVLEQRLRARGTETDDAINTRLNNALAELEFSKESGIFDRILVNDDLQAAFEELRTQILEWYPHLASGGEGAAGAGAGAAASGEDAAAAASSE